MQPHQGAATRDGEALMANFSPDWTVAPGETLLEVLQERRCTQAWLARETGWTLKHVNRVVKGHDSLTVAFALSLERALGIPAEFWLTREMHHRLYLARQGVTA